MIYIIEDVPEIANLIQLYLSKENFETKTFADAESTLKELSEGNLPELFILDINLPDMSGYDFLKKLRDEHKQSVPVIIVSARDSDEDIIKGLELGADEFVTKPFSPRTLVARVKANLRRIAITSASVEESIKFGEYVLLLNSNVLKCGSKKIPLSIKEYAVLEYLVKNAGKLLSPEQIYKDVWKTKFGDITAVAVYIQRLRKKIEKDHAKPDYIKTVFGKGYIFSEEKTED